MVATYISRLGQSFSSSIPTVSIPGNNWKTVQDFKQQKYCFSDGVGTISSSLASEVLSTDVSYELGSICLLFCV